MTRSVHPDVVPVKLSRRAKAVAAFFAALCVFAVLALALELASRWSWAQSALEEAEPRYARFAGLLENREELGLARQNLLGSLAQLAHPAELGADRIGSDLQQRVRRIAEESGMTVINSQIQGVRVKNSVQEVPVVITIEGSHDGLRNLLAALAHQTPAVQVDAFSLQPGNVQRTGRFVTVINLSALHLLP